MSADLTKGVFGHSVIFFLVSHMLKISLFLTLGQNVAVVRSWLIYKTSRVNVYFCMLCPEIFLSCFGALHMYIYKLLFSVLYVIYFSRDVLINCGVSCFFVCCDALYINCSFLSCIYNMSLVMRKQDFCLCENKGTDQLCSSLSWPLISLHRKYNSSSS